MFFFNLKFSFSVSLTNAMGALVSMTPFFFYSCKIIEWNMHEIFFLLISKYKDQNQLKFNFTQQGLEFNFCQKKRVLSLIFITIVTNSLNGNLVSTIVVCKYPLSLKISRP